MAIEKGTCTVHGSVVAGARCLHVKKAVVWIWTPFEHFFILAPDLRGHSICFCCILVVSGMKMALDTVNRSFLRSVFTAGCWPCK